jgi:signal transduction histidine kinase
VVFYLLWMFFTALLIGKRHEVLRNLDRRFFRDVEATRQSLIQLAQDLGDIAEPDAVLNALEEGARRALQPEFTRFSLPDAPEEPGVELTVPLRRGQRVLGYLLLGPKAADEPYSTEERQLLEAAAVQAAMALENARLNAALLAQQREELGVRTAGVLAGAEEERRRLAADLHDQVLPELRQIAVDVERLQTRANGMAPDLQRVAAEVRGSMDSVREVMEALRPSALDMLGLGDALESHFRKAAARCHPPLTVSVRRTGDEPHLTSEQSLGLYRICQEAINNVLKHSGAERAGLELEGETDTFRITIWDNGQGLPAGAASGTGHGLRNMRYRADLIGAVVTWHPNTGDRGLRVMVELSPAGERAAEPVDSLSALLVDL